MVQLRLAKNLATRMSPTPLALHVHGSRPTRTLQTFQSFPQLLRSPQPTPPAVAKNAENTAESESAVASTDQNI
eukprot:1634533-Pleurochrysis_carterae.AAC.1